MENMQGYLATAVFWPFGKSRSNHPAVLVAARAGFSASRLESLRGFAPSPERGGCKATDPAGGWGPSTYGGDHGKTTLPGL